MSFDLLLGSSENPATAVDAFLSLECNLCLETCTISQVLAGFSNDRPEISVAELQRLGSSADSLQRWLNIHEYLVKTLRKFQGDIGVLQRSAADIVKPFQETPGFGVFAERFRNARDRVGVLRLIFPRDAVSVPALARLRLENLDNNLLGEEFPESVIRICEFADHFELMSAQFILQQVQELVAEVKARRPQQVTRDGA